MKILLEILDKTPGPGRFIMDFTLKELPSHLKFEGHKKWWKKTPVFYKTRIQLKIKENTYGKQNKSIDQSLFPLYS